MTKSLDDFIGEISTNADDTNAAFSVAAPGRRNVSGRENPYFEGSDEVPIAHQVTESADRYEYTEYRRDIANLVEELEKFTNQGASELAEAAEILYRLKESLRSTCHETAGNREVTLIAQVRNHLDTWEGGAARSFKTQILDPFEYIVGLQALLTNEIELATRCYREAIRRAHKDARHVAKALSQKTRDEGVDVEVIGDVLMVAGIIAGGISAIPTGPIAAAISGAAGAASAAGSGGGEDESGEDGAGRAGSLVSWMAGSAEAIMQEYVGIESRQEEEAESSPNLELHGELAAEFIPSSLHQLESISTTGDQGRHLIRSGLRSHLSEVSDLVEFNESALSRAVTPDELGDADGDAAAVDVGNLKAVAEYNLPIVAQNFEDARLDLEEAKSLIETGISSSEVLTGLDQDEMFEAIDRLNDAFVSSRDFIYDASENLSRAADMYFETEEENERMLDEYDSMLSQLEDVPGDPEAYSPGQEGQ